MAPGNQPDAVRRLVRFLAKFKHFVRARQNGFKFHAHWNRFRRIQRPGYFLGMSRDLPERFRAIQMLAAGNEPQLKPFWMS